MRFWSGIHNIWIYQLSRATTTVWKRGTSNILDNHHTKHRIRDGSNISILGATTTKIHQEISSSDSFTINIGNNSPPIRTNHGGFNVSNNTSQVMRGIKSARYHLQPNKQAWFQPYRVEVHLLIRGNAFLNFPKIS